LTIWGTKAKVVQNPAIAPKASTQRGSSHADGVSCDKFIYRPF
jgi:hypothetical protein